MFNFGKHSRPDRKETAGEIVFDRTVYTGIGLIVNELSGLALAVEMRYFGGKERFQKAARWLHKTIGYKDKIEHGKLITGHTRAEDALEIFTLLLSGTALIVPMKVLEDNKAKIVKKFNHTFDKFHHRSAEEVKARDEDVEKEIACEPKQTWSTLILGRAIATAHNMFFLKEAVFGGTRTQKVKDVSKRYIDKSVDKLHGYMGGKPDSMLVKMRGTERYKYYSEIIGLDTLYTIVSSVVLEIASKALASKKPLVKNPELCEQVQKEKQEKATDKTNCTACAKHQGKKSILKRNAPEPAASYAEKVSSQTKEHVLGV